jgi:hypothetical protein
LLRGLKPFNYETLEDEVPRQKKSPLKIEDDIIYEGDWSLDGVMHGNGMAIYPDGSIYQGAWKHGQKNGKGRMVQSNGDYYVGDWVDDQREGFGKLFEKS